jgi:hypothetical protein
VADDEEVEAEVEVDTEAETETETETVVVEDPPAETETAVADDPDVVTIETDESGAGTGLYGDDADNVLAVSTEQGEASFGPSHTIGITAVSVEGAAASSTVTVRVTSRRQE